MPAQDADEEVFAQRFGDVVVQAAGAAGATLPPPSFLAEMARNEVDPLSPQIKSGLAEALRKGRKLGRPAGTCLERSELLAKHRDIIRLLKAGQSVRNTAKISGKGMSTVQRVKAALAA